MRRNEPASYYIGLIDAVENYCLNNPSVRITDVLSILNICGFPEKKRDIDVVTFEGDES